MEWCYGDVRCNSLMLEYIHSSNVQDRRVMIHSACTLEFNWKLFVIQACKQIWFYYFFSSCQDLPHTNTYQHLPCTNTCTTYQHIPCTNTYHVPTPTMYQHLPCTNTRTTYQHLPTPTMYQHTYHYQHLPCTNTCTTTNTYQHLPCTNTRTTHQHLLHTNTYHTPTSTAYQHVPHTNTYYDTNNITYHILLQSLLL